MCVLDISHENDMIFVVALVAGMWRTARLIADVCSSSYSVGEGSCTIARDMRCDADDTSVECACILYVGPDRSVGLHPTYPMRRRRAQVRVGVGFMRRAYINYRCAGRIFQA